MRRQFFKMHDRRICYLVLLAAIAAVQVRAADLFSNYQEDVQLDDITITRASIAPAIKKKINFILFVAADNDLDTFARRNIRQMTTIGSSKDMNILVHLDIRTANQKMTRWYYVEKDNLIILNANDKTTQRMDSGDPQTVITWVTFALENFPAEHNILVFWNHGSGTIDPGGNRTLNPLDLFVYNPITDTYDLDRSVGFLDLLEARGVCWDDTTGHFLTNQKLEHALKMCCAGPLHGGVFDVIGFDACLMGMTEVAEIIKRYARFMIASEEVELGPGWNYEKVLSALTNIARQGFNELDVAHAFIQTYNATYGTITNDYTLSALDLSLMKDVENNVDLVAKLLMRCLKNQKSNSVKQTLRWCKSRQNCTHFDEPRYIDLHHLYANIRTHLDKLVLANDQLTRELRYDLDRALTQGMKLIEQLVVANCTGKNVPHAKGLSIYWPEDAIHQSYRKTSFANNNSWYQFITYFLTV